MNVYSSQWRAEHRVEPDPHAVDLAVDGVPVDLTAEQRMEAVQRLWGRRWSDPAIAERLGLTARSVLRIRQRAGLPGWASNDQIHQLRAA